MTIETIQYREPLALSAYQKGDFRRLALVRLASRYVVGKRVLDLRCATGDLAVALAMKGFEVSALGSHQQSVEMANDLAGRRGFARRIAELWNFTGLAARVGNGPFDTVLCLDALSHIGDDQKLIEEVSQVLANNGRLILIAPAMPGLYGKRDEYCGYVKRYTKAALVALIERNGLAVDLIRCWNFAALPIYFVFEKILGKGISDDLRTARFGSFRSVPNRILGWWYRHVENRLLFPCGLSLFVVAHKQNRTPQPFT